MAVSLLHKHADIIIESQLDFTAILKVSEDLFDNTTF